MLPKRVINSNSKDPLFVSQYDRVRNKTGGFNKTPIIKKIYRFVRVDGSNLKLGSTRAALFKLADKLPDSYYRRKLMRLAHNMPQHLMSYGVFLNAGLTQTDAPEGTEYLFDWFKIKEDNQKRHFRVTVVTDGNFRRFFTGPGSELVAFSHIITCTVKK